MYTLLNSKVSALALSTAADLDKSQIYCLDLDEVLICAKHRQLTKKDGSLDLEHYRENSTPEKIAKDKGLPLLQFAQHLTKIQRPFYVVTARIPCQHTRTWLRANGVKPKQILGRDGEHDRRPDHQLKQTKILAKFGKVLKNVVLVDDRKTNCLAVEAIGAMAIHIELETQAEKWVRITKELTAKLTGVK